MKLSSLLALALLIACSTATNGDAATLVATGKFDPCPSLKDVRAAGGVYTLQLATTGVMQRLPKVYGDIAPGYPFRVQLVGGILLARRYYVPSKNNPADPLRYYQAASRVCGPGIAGMSWAFTVNFPYAGGVLWARYVVFVVRARSGWKLYGELPLN